MRNPLVLARPRALAPGQQAHPPVPLSSKRATVGGGSAMTRGTSPLSAMAATGTSFAVVDLLANSTAQVDWALYTVPASGVEEDRQPVTAHAALDVWNQPNPYMTRQYLVEAVQQHYELCGTGALVVYKMGSMPVELWPVRPDRLVPIPHPTKFLTGWTYLSPDNEKVPLKVDEVLILRTPNPEDPFSGLGPFGALAADLDASRYSAEWNRNFFVNSAEPGGIIEIAESLDDDEFAEKRARWQEQHRGVAAAHRVAILEAGMKWVTNSITQRDMQFVELRKMSRDTIMEAKRVHGHMLGITEDVNLANAQAADATFARWQSIPRLERWKQMLNTQFLPMFGSTATGREFDYANPVPEDEEQERAELTAKVNAWSVLVDKGADPAGAARAVGLPEIDMVGDDGSGGGASPDQIAVMVQKLYLGVGTIITWEEGRQILADAGAQLDLSVPAPAAAPSPFARVDAIRLDRPQLPAPRAAAGDEDFEQVDHTETQAAWERILEQLLAEWTTVNAAWHADLIAQVQAAVDAGNLPALAGLQVDTAEAELVLAEHMDRMAVEASHKVVREATQQGVDGVEAKQPTRSDLADLAAVTAALIGGGVAAAAGREAMRVQSTETTGVQVADLVAEHLAGLSPPRGDLGGALTGAQNQARIETFRSAPEAALYADERMDKATCGPCREINGRWIGNSADGTSMAEVQRLYPQGGYVNCLGRSRCRGTITGVFRPQTVRRDGD